MGDGKRRVSTTLIKPSAYMPGRVLTPQIPRQALASANLIMEHGISLGCQTYNQNTIWEKDMLESAKARSFNDNALVDIMEAPIYIRENIVKITATVAYSVFGDHTQTMVTAHHQVHIRHDSNPTVSGTEITDVVDPSIDILNPFSVARDEDFDTYRGYGGVYERTVFTRHIANPSVTVAEAKQGASHKLVVQAYAEDTTDYYMPWWIQLWGEV